MFANIKSRLCCVFGSKGGTHYHGYVKSPYNDEHIMKVGGYLNCCDYTVNPNYIEEITEEEAKYIEVLDFSMFTLCKNLNKDDFYQGIDSYERYQEDKELMNSYTIREEREIQERSI